MHCRKCETDLDESNIKAGVAAHDEFLLDIIIECPKCGHRINEFVHEMRFADMDKE